ncbi:Uncharacterised protein [Bordetella pertussis]|nr:Uncharacterised protein [Bordetella pertussis]
MPAWVRAVARFERSNSRIPTCVSSSLIMELRPAWVTCRASAARVKLRTSATSRKAWSWRVDTLMSVGPMLVGPVFYHGVDAAGQPSLGRTRCRSDSTFQQEQSALSLYYRIHLALGAGFLAYALYRV